jgi:hypothetical protein
MIKQVVTILMTLFQTIINNSEHYYTLILNHLNQHGIQKDEFEVCKKNFYIDLICFISYNYFLVHHILLL